MGVFVTKVIIIDDDIEMLYGLSNIINNANCNIEVIKQADNGIDGLELIKNNIPDVIITDITMPGIDGLKLIKEAKKIKPNIKVIILTCHEDFNFAREAIKLQADYYMVKITLTEEEIMSALIKIRDEIQSEAESEKYIKLVENQFNINRIIIESKFFLDIIDNKFNTNEEMYERSEFLSIKIPDRSYRVVGFFIKNLNKSITKLDGKSSEEYKNVIVGFLNKGFESFDKKTVFCYSDESYFVILQSDNIRIINEKLKRVLKNIKDLLLNELKFFTYICVSEIYKDILNLGSAIKELDLLNDTYFYNENAPYIQDSTIFSNDSIYTLYKEFKEEFRYTLKIQKKELIEECLEKMFFKIQNEKYTPSNTKQFLNSIALEIGSIAINYGIIIEENVIDEKTLASYRLALNKMVDELLCKFNSLNNISQRKEIKAALKYIFSHLDEKLTCEEVASIIGYNVNYFSRLFKKEIGISYSDYLIKIRIERATFLLENTDIAIEEITNAIGLSNVSHFYRIYKKITGNTPNQVRKQNL